MAEWELQKDCYEWFCREYPAHQKLLCYNMNNANSHIIGNQYKSMGLQKGRSDLVLYFNGAAIMIELKIDNNDQSEAQKEWQLAVEIQGFEYYIIRNSEDFKILMYHIMVEPLIFEGFENLRDFFEYGRRYIAGNN